MPRIFCGNGRAVPAGYDALGTRYACLRKGFGAGRASARGSWLPALALALAALAVFVGVRLYNRKWRCVKGNDQHRTRRAASSVRGTAGHYV